jgi:hypothetical protein
VVWWAAKVAHHASHIIQVDRPVGQLPAIEIGTDLSDPHAQDVLLDRVEVEG